MKLTSQQSNAFDLTEVWLQKVILNVKSKIFCQLRCNPISFIKYLNTVVILC